MNSLNALKTNLQGLSREDLSGNPLFKRAFQRLFGEDDRTFKFELNHNMDNLETQLNKEKLHETDSKNAVRMLKTPFQKFFHSKLLKTSNYDYNVREAIEDFKDYTQEAQFFKDLIIQNMESIEKYINEKALHE
ncbi:hypothetical protein Tco_0477726 [Tanacetum coccineum]